MTKSDSAGRKVRIGGASAGYGDGLLAAPRLIRDGELDYLMFDFLSEYYMPMAGRMRRQDPAKGYVLEFPGDFAAIVVDLLQRGVKLVTNAGAVNPHACAAAMAEAAAKVGATPKIAVVDGDDLFVRSDALRRAGRLKAEVPNAGYTGINAYVGAFPIARALALGADVVVTGRVVDSALALGPLIHAFGWSAEDYDRMAAGSMIGHLLECGAQASGGIYTDWREVADYSDIGYPIAECYADGTCIITKPSGTGGLVTVGTVAEQLLYEIADPRDYRLPDVAVDLSDVRMEQTGPDKVRVTGAKGRPPGPNFKGIATWDEGWIGGYGFVMRGPDAADKARATVDSVMKRGAAMLRARNMAPFRRTRVEVLGNEETFGAQGRGGNSREVFCRVALEHEDPKAIGLLMREQGTASVSMAPGIAGSFLFSPTQPIARSEAFFLPAIEVPVTVTLGSHRETMTRAVHGDSETGALPAPPATTEAADTTVSLSKLAWVRSGDKGNTCNVGVIARDAAYLPYIAAALDEERVRRHYAHMFADGTGEVRRYYLPGTAALNFLLIGALDGGCTVSLSYDPFGKSAAQEVLDIPIPIPQALLAG
jgi:hypothetical protein